MPTPRNAAAFDIHASITQAIVQAIENGIGEHRLPWARTGTPSVRPRNAVTKQAYRGINVLSLWLSAEQYGFTHGLWASYRQWLDAGAQVRKGEKGTLVVFYKDFTVDPNPDQADDDGSRRVARASWVFNASQVDGYTLPGIPDLPPIEREAAAEAFIGSTGADIRHGGDMAYYRPSTDHIQMPDERLFTGSKLSSRTEDYYSVLGHELTHWAGAEKRLNRLMRARFGDEAYAMEELVAELGAAFLCADLGITHTPRADHASYIAHWLKVLKDDKRAIFTAAAKASEAVAYLQDFANAMEVAYA